MSESIFPLLVFDFGMSGASIASHTGQNPSENQPFEIFQKFLTEMTFMIMEYRILKIRSAPGAPDIRSALKFWNFAPKMTPSI